MEDDKVIKYVLEAQEENERVVLRGRRARRAYKGYPSKRAYKVTASMLKEDKNFKVAEEKPVAVRDCVDTYVSAVIGGVDRWEFEPVDDHVNVNAKVFDRLDNAAQLFYRIQEVEQKFKRQVKGAVFDASAYLYMKHDKKKHLPQVTYVPRHQMLIDPIRANLPNARFIGHTQRMSFRQLKDSMTSGSRAGTKLKGFKEAEDNLRTLMTDIEKYASGDKSGMNFDTSDNIQYQLCHIYKDNIDRHREEKKRAKEPSKVEYESDEVEVSYIYVTTEKKEYTVVNRRHIVRVRDNPYKKNFKRKVPSKDANGDYILKDNGDQQTKEVSYTCEVDHPYIELIHSNEDDGDLTSSPLHQVLDKFDKLADLESLLCDVIQWMSVPIILGTSTDNKKLSLARNMVAELVDGAVTDAAVFNKQYPIQPLQEYIMLIEQDIKDAMGCFDQQRLAQMIGDRSSAKEASAAHGLVIQRYNSFIQNIECAAAELGDKFIKFMFLYEEKILFGDGEESDYIENESIVGDYLVGAKLKSSMKVEEAQISASARELMAFLSPITPVGTPRGDAMLEVLLPKALMGKVSRNELNKMLGKDKVSRQAHAQAELAKLGPGSEVSNISPEQLTQLGVEVQQRDGSFNDPDLGANHRIGLRASRPAPPGVQDGAQAEAGGVAANNPDDFI